MRLQTSPAESAGYASARNHHAKVKAVAGSRVGESGTVTSPFVPLNFNAPARIPPSGCHVAPPESMPLLPKPELSGAVRPDASSSLSHMTRPGSGPSVVVGPALIVTSAESSETESLAVIRTTYMPANGKLAIVSSLVGSKKIAFVGPLIVDHEYVSGAGKPSSTAFAT